MADYNFKNYNFDKVPSIDFGQAASFEPIVGNIFEGRAPSFDIPFSEIGSNFEPYADQYRYSDTSSDSKPSWLGKGIEALNKALAYKGSENTGSSGGSRSYRGYSSSAPAVAQGRGYTMYQPSPTQKTTQTGGSKGFGSSIGSVLGTVAGLALAPATGGTSAALGYAGLGGSLGGTLGGFFG